MKKEDIDLQVYQHMVVCIQPTCIFTEANHMTGAVVVTPRSNQCVTDNASGLSQDLDLLPSTYHRVGILRCAIVR